MRCFVVVATLSLLLPQRGFAQNALDLLPEDAAVAVAIRHLDELIKRGDKFLVDTDIKVPIRPSELFDMGAQAIGVANGLDRKRPAAIVLMAPQKGENTKSFTWFEQNLVPVLPFTDADVMAANFGFAKGALKPNDIRPTSKVALPILTKFATRSDSHLYLAGAQNTLERIRKSKPLAQALAPEQRKRFEQSDVLVHMGRFLWTLDDLALSKELASKVRPGADPQEKAFAEAFARAVTEVQHAVFGARIQDGLDTQFVATVSPDGAAAKLLASLRKQKQSSSLRHLPEGNVLFAQASSGDSTQRALLAKSILNFVLEDLLRDTKLVANADRLKYLGILHEVWSRLEGHRLAVYQNPNEANDGLFAVVAILDAEDPAEFLREMRTLARMARADTLDWTKSEVKEEIDIPRLIKDLGSKVFKVRQSADLKLVLVGEPALPYLQKSIDSKELDLETLRRCENLRQQISDVAAVRRKELLRETQAPLFPRPKLTFVSNAEARQGQSVDVINIKMLGHAKDTDLQAAEYKQLFGRDWDKLRVVTLGKQLVLMLGSNVELFDAAVRNVQKKDAGLASSKSLATFYEHSARERLFELHVSVEGILRLTTPQARLDTKTQLTSVSLMFGSASLEVDARLPTSEVRAMARKAQAVLR